MVRDESQRQNLVSNKTLCDLYSHHAQDSIQLSKMICSGDVVADVGSGAGFPGIVVSIFAGAYTHLVEPRTKRAQFLRRVVETLGLPATVHKSKVSAVDVPCDVVIARGVGTIQWLLTNAQHLLHKKSRVLLIKSSDFAQEIDSAKALTFSGGAVRQCDFKYSATPLERGTGYIIELSEITYKA
jgi:16S rRNA (guanine527-N7)-methyltransferase